MMNGNRMRYIAGHEVDKRKWDECINAAKNGLVYHSAMGLDMMSDNWNAVIVDDYKAVVPLPWRKKFFVPYYYRVPFIPQGGIIGEFDPALFGDLKRTIFSKVRFGDLLLNFDNAAFARHISARPLINMVLKLVEYPNVISSYKRGLESRLKKAVKKGFNYEKEKDLKLAVALFRKQYASKIQRVRNEDYERFTAFCLYLQERGNAVVRKVTDSKGKLMAIAILLMDRNRIYNMMNTVLPEGRGKSANHYLFDQLIVEFAGTGLMLDFGGSEVPWIRKFYAEFGAENQPYYWFRKIV